MDNTKYNCKYIKAWIGECGIKSDKEFCQEHRGNKCELCGKQSFGQCEEIPGSFVCGSEICKNKCHRHIEITATG